MKVTEFLDTPLLYACRHLFFGAKESFYADPDASVEKACKQTFNLDPEFAKRCKGMLLSHPGEIFPFGEGIGCLLFRPLDPKGAFILFPGGGYEILAIGESAPLVEPLLKSGYSVGIVMYSTKKAAKWPSPLFDAIAAEKAMLEHCPEANRRLIAMGFSAGGHLATNFASEHWAKQYHYRRPDALILAYPVISLLLPTHERSKAFVTGKDPSLIELLSAERHVDPAFPPTFLWRCASDPIVPMVNSDEFAESLREAGVKHEYHVYPGDGHGWGIGENSSAENWLQKAIRFVE